MKRRFLIDGQPVEVAVTRLEGGLIRLEAGGRSLEVRGEPLGGGWWRLESPEGAARRVWVGEAGEGSAGGAEVWIGGRPARVEAAREEVRAAGRVSAGASGGSVAAQPGSAPMPGVVVRMLEPGTVVEKGAVVASITAMKMEHAIRAPWAARVVRQCAAVGKPVAKGAILVELEQIHDV